MSVIELFWGLIALNLMSYFSFIIYQGKKHQEALERIDALEKSLKRAISDEGVNISDTVSAAVYDRTKF